jgi:protein O-mannosyl-transferase
MNKKYENRSIFHNWRKNISLNLKTMPHATRVGLPIYPVFLILIIFAVFFMSIHFPFLKGFDDNVYILYNKHLDFSSVNITYWFTHSYIGSYIPLSMISYMCDYSLWGLNSFGYHLQNIFWHIVAAIAIYKCFSLFNIKPWIAFLLCLIFAIHPQRVESVVWISERKDVLCTAFYFLSIYFYIKNYDKKKSVAALVFFIFSMLSKPMAVSLPIILLLYEFYKNNKVKSLETVDYRLKEKTGKSQAPCGYKCYLSKLWPYFLILLILIPVSIIAHTNVGAAHSFNQILSFQRLYTVSYNIYWYFAQTVLPIDLNPVYPYQIYFTSLIELILFYTASIFIIIIILKKNWKFFVYKMLPLLFAFLVSLLPVVGIIRLGSIDHADRYSYIPSVFIWFSIGLVLTQMLYKNDYVCTKFKSTFFHNKKFIFLILSFYSIILVVLNCLYQKNWKNNYSLFSHAANYPLANISVLISLADAELQKGNYWEVLSLAEKLKQKNNNSSMAAFFEASVMYNLDKKAAIKPLLKVKHVFKIQSGKNLDRNLRYIRIMIMLVHSYDSIGEKQKTVECINELLKYEEISSFAKYSLKGLKAECENNLKKAIYYYKRTLDIDSGDIEVKNKIEECVRKLKRTKSKIKRCAEKSKYIQG